MFAVEPFKTTQRDIIKFAQQSSLPEGIRKTAIQNGWIHPGYYCPNNCRMILFDGPLLLPAMSLDESITIAIEFARRHFPQFLHTHGITSRIVCCVFCQKFGGVHLEGENPKAVYRQPRLKPFCNKRIISAVCSDPKIHELNTAWWYAKGKSQAKCDFFEHEISFEWVYKDITGWNEYPP